MGTREEISRTQKPLGNELLIWIAIGAGFLHAARCFIRDQAQIFTRRCGTERLPNNRNP
jgi:hypothetical protein